MIVLLILVCLSSCYKGDPGYGGPDYPPDGIIELSTCDAGRG